MNSNAHCCPIALRCCFDCYIKGVPHRFPLVKCNDQRKILFMPFSISAITLVLAPNFAANCPFVLPGRDLSSLMELFIWKSPFISLQRLQSPELHTTKTTSG